MPYINLIQENRLAVQANERKARGFFMAFVAIAVAGGSAFGFLTMESMVVAGQAHGVEQENKKNEPIAKQIEQNGKALAEMTPKIKTLEDAQTITDRWNHIFYHLAVNTPQSAWLTAIRCQGNDPTKPIRVSFVGLATSQSPVGEFMLRLQNQPDLENVTLGFTNEKMATNGKGIEFQIDGDLAGSAEQKIKAADGEEKK
jgi:Tfp pilus assembly protein PilN